MTTHRLKDVWYAEFSEHPIDIRFGGENALDGLGGRIQFEACRFLGVNPSVDVKVLSPKCGHGAEIYTTLICIKYESRNLQIKAHGISPGIMNIYVRS